MNLKLGKLPYAFDRRTIPLNSVLKIELPPLPDEWEFSKQYPQLDLSPKMWGNDIHGNCVYVASLAQQRDFEVIEQGKIIEIDEKIAEKDYLSEAGGDYGLVMLNHLKRWKKQGLPFGTGRKLLCLSFGVPKYNIHAYASVDCQSQKQMKYAIYLLGCNIGALMPDSFQDQFEAGHPWDDTSLPPNPRNGHAMKVRGWTYDGLILWTWGKLQLATWPWIYKYSDEGWAIVDEKDKADSIIDPEKLESFLQEITD
jgi:hypothetical protein